MIQTRSQHDVDIGAIGSTFIKDFDECPVQPTSFVLAGVAPIIA